MGISLSSRTNSRAGASKAIGQIEKGAKAKGNNAPSRLDRKREAASGKIKAN